MLPKKIIKKCQDKLLKTKNELLNQVQAAQHNMNNLISSEGRLGDEADQTVRMIEEKNFVNRANRVRVQLMEIEMALARIEQGCYGICEETGEIIEQERLMTLPWTSLSIEGAEIRETMRKKQFR